MDWIFFAPLQVLIEQPCVQIVMETHPIAPVYNSQSRVLILGSFPSVKSRESCFFYGHPQNRFWKVLAGLWNEPVPLDIEEKKAFLLQHHIALWDVIARCSIEGSADSSIRQVTPVDLEPILKSAPIEAVFTNGKAADALYKKYLLQQTHIPAICLPSTSPANAACQLPCLLEKWQPVRLALESQPERDIAIDNPPAS